MGECAEQLIEGQIEGILDEDGCYTGIDDDDFFEQMKQEKREKKRKNVEYAKKIFAEKGVKFDEKPNFHFILKDFNYWPSTGLFIHKISKKKGRGIFNLLKKIKG